MIGNPGILAAMLVVADTHVHFYPCHDRDTWLRAAVRNLGGGGKILALTERHDCHAFRDNVFQADRVGEGALCATVAGAKLFILAGRQVVTKERLEVLALTTDAGIPDGQPIRDVIARVQDAGGIPVIAWAPGKWFFARGKIVLDVLEKAEPGSLLIGDSSLRPTVWPEPDLMSYAHQKGFNLIAGSDPLPFAGEERYVGSYGVSCDAEFDETRPAASMRVTLSNPATKFLLRGKRCRLGEVVGRLRKNRAAKT